MQFGNTEKSAYLGLSSYTFRGFNNFGDKRLFEVEQTAVIEKEP